VEISDSENLAEKNFDSQKAQKYKADSWLRSGLGPTIHGAFSANE
jgi:hypothetical protein